MEAASNIARSPMVGPEPLLRPERSAMSLGIARPFAACAAVAIVSLVVLPSGLGSDPWAWMVWGRELAHLHLSITGGPAFKPLPVVLAAISSPLGGAAVPVWLALARASALFSIFLAFRLGTRLGGRTAGQLAGAAVALPLLTVLWATLEGYLEPTLIALTLLAVDRHLARRPTQAILLGGAVALGRPEIWPLLVAYAVVARPVRARTRVAYAALLLALPAAWLVPDLLAGGGSATAGAEASRGHPLTLATQALMLMSLPAVAGIVATTAKAVRERQRVMLGLVIAGLVWIALVVVTSHPDARYMMLPVAVLSIPAGIGAAWALRALSARRARVLLVACGLAALPFPLAAAWAGARDQRTLAAQLSDLRGAVAAAGGARHLRRLPEPVVNPVLQPALAWQLGVPLSRVRLAAERRPTSEGLEGWHRTRWRAPAVVFATPATHATGPAPELRRPGVVTIARTRWWRVAVAR